MSRYSKIHKDQLGDLSHLATSGSESIIKTSGSFSRAALTGDVTAELGKNKTTITPKAVDFSKIQDIAKKKLLGRHEDTPGDVQEIELGDNLAFIDGKLTALGAGAATKIPAVIYNDNRWHAVSDNFLQRYIYTGPAGGELCITASVLDEGKEIIFNNATQLSMDIHADSTGLYNNTGLDPSSRLWGISSYEWIRARVLLTTDPENLIPYFLIIERGRTVVSV